MPSLRFCLPCSFPLVDLCISIHGRFTSLANLVHVSFFIHSGSCARLGAALQTAAFLQTRINPGISKEALFKDSSNPTVVCSKFRVSLHLW